MRKRLLVLTSTFPRWAGDNQPPFIFELCRRLSSNYEVFVLAPHAHGARARESSNGLHVTRFRYFFSKMETLAYDGGILANLKRNPMVCALIPLFLISQLIAAVRIVRQQRIGIVHAHWIIPQGVIGGLIRTFMRSPPLLMCTSHGSDLHKLVGAPFFAIQRWVMRKADTITVVSNALRQEAESIEADTSKIHVIPMGIDTVTLFTPGPAAARRHQSLLFVGRLIEDKGAIVLLRALKIVLQKYSEVTLQVVGHGPEERALKEFAQINGLTRSVRFLGAVANSSLPALYQEATIFVSPSLSEGFGLTLAEALACECAVIATDLPAIRDLVIDGETGVTVPKNDPDELAKKILFLLANPDLRQHLAEQGRSHVRQRYDWVKIVDQYRALVDSLLA